MKRLTQDGQSAVEFALVVPLLIFALIGAIEVMLLCVRGELLASSGEGAARAAQVFQLDDLAATLPARVTGPRFGELTLDHAYRSPSGIGRLFMPQRLRVQTQFLPAIDIHLPNAVLAGGDNSGPYCRINEEVIVRWPCDLNPAR